jgi:DNA polymerase-3 subunit beta
LKTATSSNSARKLSSVCLKSVSYGQSTDENRYILNGVYFSFADEKLTLGGNRRASTWLSPLWKLKSPMINTGSLILPAKTVAELERLAW